MSEMKKNSRSRNGGGETKKPGKKMAQPKGIKTQEAMKMQLAKKHGMEDDLKDDNQDLTTTLAKL